MTADTGVAALPELARRAVTGLDPAQRQVLQLVYQGRWTQAEIARLLAVSPRQVAAAVSEALRTVAAFIEGYPIR